MEYFREEGEEEVCLERSFRVSFVLSCESERVWRRRERRRWGGRRVELRFVLG